MSSQLLICIVVLVAVSGGLVYRLSSKLESLRDYTKRVCCVSVFGICSMKKNSFALIWVATVLLQGSEETEYLWTHRIIQKYEVTVKHLNIEVLEVLLGTFYIALP